MVFNTVFISLGSNLGDREKALSSAISKLPPEVTPVIASKIYETEPWGFTDQPSFLNQVIKATTFLDPFQLLIRLKNIEKEIGRQPNFRYGPRVIDLDILFFNDKILETDSLSIPHKEICNRAFVLVPMLEIAPDFIHPVSGKSIEEIASIIDHNDVKIFTTDRGK